MYRIRDPAHKFGRHPIEHREIQLLSQPPNAPQTNWCFCFQAKS